MAVRVAALLLLVPGLTLLAQDAPPKTGWKFDPEKSNGPAPACFLKVQVPIVTPSAEVPPKPAVSDGQPPRLPPPHTAKCSGSYRFTLSPDGQTLTLTQPQVDPKFKAVFNRQ